MFTLGTGDLCEPVCGDGIVGDHGAAVKLRNEMSRLGAWALKGKERTWSLGLVRGAGGSRQAHKKIDQLLGTGQSGET